MDAGAKIACGQGTGNYYITSDGLMQHLWICNKDLAPDWHIGDSPSELISECTDLASDWSARMLGTAHQGKCDVERSDWAVLLAAREQLVYRHDTRPLLSCEGAGLPDYR